MKKKISITIDNAVLDQIDQIIDNIFIRNRSQAIEYLAGKAIGENKTAVVLCGGEEKRLELKTETYSVNVKIGQITLIEKAIKKLRENSFKNIFVVARHKILTKIFEILKDGAKYGIKITYVEEKTSNGSADSLRLLKGKIKGSFLVVYGDLVFDKINIEEIWNDHLKQGAITTLMMTTSNKPSEKGTLKVEGSRVLEFTQKPTKSDIYLVFSPIFVCEEEVFDIVGKSLEEDVFPKLAKRGLLRGHLSSEKEIHIHSIEDLKKANL